MLNPTHGHPHIASWSGERAGILKRKDESGEFIAIKVFNFKNQQPPIAEEKCIKYLSRGTFLHGRTGDKELSMHGLVMPMKKYS